MSSESPGLSQGEIADALARRISPGYYAMDRWAYPSIEYFRDLYGGDVADEIRRSRDYEMFLSDKGRFGEYVLHQLGIEPPYEVSVPQIFPDLNIESIISELKDKRL
ncbi:MAG: hypothetical protein A3B14_02500 [Candidatus Zambryskibacteria bacterium RIFCSPLOWO2_01_FULL_45_21]|uniref:Uncharacterized protein n=1 Tax=Candidatus Zambryskibacteria bacterium RIFCSPLOWO2_01_FULL_45_21 TaxID=1802761 RepID=A0A1G2U0Y2_9BACT|nr:MAG: hypothetical protein A3B14_02500 [Candidatus Zambryskibacteria bacterium RIFCSPLOWO2_01_FULL_45_21]